MDLFEKFLIENSYRFPKGYPDLENTEDVELLENLINEILGEDLIQLGEVQLSPIQLAKPFYTESEFQDRGEKLLNKILKGEPITLNSGEEIVMDIDGSRKAIEILKKRDYDSLGKGNKVFLGKDDKMYSLSNFKKTVEFGSGRGSGGGAASTDKQESSQCLVNAIAYYIKPENPITLEDLTEENINKASAYVDISSSIEECIEFINNETSWKETFIKTANLLKSKYSNNSFEFHRGSEFVNGKIYGSFKKTKIGLNADKWNPADIWMVNKNILGMEFPSNIEELNQTLLDLYKDHKLIGVSLKKLGKDAHLEPHNDGKEIENKHHIQNVISSPKSKETTIIFDDGKITFRTFNFASNLSGEIKGKTAAHGKIGLNQINTILQKNKEELLPSTNDVKIKYQLNDENFLKEFHKVYTNIVEDISFEDFETKCSEKGLDWVVSKYISNKIADTISKSNKKESILNGILMYASSESPHSSVFVKIS